MILSSFNIMVNVGYKWKMFLAKIQFFEQQKQQIFNHTIQKFEMNA